MNQPLSDRGHPLERTRRARATARAWPSPRLRSSSAIGLLALSLAASAAFADTLKVGPHHPLRLPSQAAALARDGDTIEIEAAYYPGDAAVWRASNLTIRGIGGKAQLLSQGVTAEGKAIWVVKGRNTTIENIAFIDARVPDRNGAGIRLEGANLTVRDCLFRDNENGILTGANPESEVLVEGSEFDHNGHGDGRSHNIYIGAIRKFTLRNSVSQNARIGHQVKSRAAVTLIQNNRIQDGPTGRSSYLIDLPSGGDAVIEGNTLHRGKWAENHTMVAYGAENMPHAMNQLRVIGNTFVNDLRQGCRLIWVKPRIATAAVSRNRFVGCTRIDGAVQMADNITMAKE